MLGITLAWRRGLKMTEKIEIEKKIEFSISLPKDKEYTEEEIVSFYEEVTQKVFKSISELNNIKGIKLDFRALYVLDNDFTIEY